MKNFLIVTFLLSCILACRQQGDPVKPTEPAHSGAKRAPEVSVEDWGGLTMSILAIDVANHDTTWGTNWVGIPVKINQVSHENTNTWGVAWGQITNYQEIEDGSATWGGMGSDGMFYVYQRNTGPDPYGGDRSGPRAPLDASSVIGQVQWLNDDPHYFGTIRPDTKQRFIDVLNDLKDHYQAEADNQSLLAEMNRFISNLNANNSAASVVTTIDDFNVLITGRMVRKPDGTYGIVPPHWVPPVQ